MFYATVVSNASVGGWHRSASVINAVWFLPNSHRAISFLPLLGISSVAFCYFTALSSLSICVGDSSATKPVWMSLYWQWVAWEESNILDTLIMLVM